MVGGISPQQAADCGNHGQGGLGGTALPSIDRGCFTIEITDLHPKGCEYDYGTKVHCGELRSSKIVQVPRKHIYDLGFLTDW